MKVLLKMLMMMLKILEKFGLEDFHNRVKLQMTNQSFSNVVEDLKLFF